MESKIKSLTLSFKTEDNIIENIKISYAGIYKGVAHFVGPSIRVAILDDRIIFTRGLNVQKLFEELEAYIAC